jgi:hypothetical protein
MKIKTFILIAALWANIAISDNSKTTQVRYQFAIIRYYLVAVFGRWVF